jgi:quercetin dioxygenase-like cupin family protein
MQAERRLKTMKMTATICVLALAPFSTAQAQQQQPTSTGLNDSATIHPADRITWQVGPPSLPPGAKFAVLEGDPAKDGFFTMRLRLPDGYKIPPHTHPKVEHVTVISGTFNFGMGDKFAQAATQAMPAGTFGFWPAGMKHFAWAKGETVLQLHGIGPWKIEYVNPADDPRKPK